LTALLDGRTDALASVGENSTIAFAADVVGPLIGHAQYAPTAWVGRMHAEPPGVRTTGWLRYEAHGLRASAKPTRRKGIA
jgi:hypothetical protein